MADTPRHHAITPVPGSCRQLDGTPADLMKEAHYPVEAVCQECGGPIRIERHYSPMWDHVERFSGPSGSRAAQA